MIERSIKTSAIVHFSIANQMEYDGAEVGGPGLWPIHTFQSTISTGSTVCMNLFTWEELYADRLSNWAIVKFYSVLAVKLWSEQTIDIRHVHHFDCNKKKKKSKCCHFIHND